MSLKLFKKVSSFSIKWYNVFRIQWLLVDCVNFNTYKSRSECRTKKRGRLIFKINNIPHAKGKVFFNPISAYIFAKKIGFPLVLKPNFGGFSRGSFFPIKNFKDFFKAFFLTKFFWPRTVVESYLKGKNYRILVYRGNIIAVTQRFPPFVIGDGKSTIKDLIRIENKIRKKMKIYPSMSPLSIDKKTQKYLKLSNLTLNSVPKKEKYVELRHRVALGLGGIVENIPLNKVSKKNQELFKKVLKSFDAIILGIDVIFEKDIEYDYDSQKCIFIEVNSRPYINMHKYPRYGNKIDIDEYVKEEYDKQY